MRFTGRLSALAVVLAFVVYACTNPAGPGPQPSPSPSPSTSPATQDAPPPPTGGAGDTGHVIAAEDNNGLRVEVIFDEWGPGSCHTTGGLRKFRLTNESNVTKYSKTAAYTSKEVTCATQERQTGRPNEGGCLTVDPGQSCEYWMRITLPDGEDSCTLQADNCWGPGGRQGCSVVVADSFKIPEKKCKVCIENPKPISEEGCGDWSQCPPKGTPKDQCYREKPCWETTGTDYRCKDDVTSTRRWTVTDPCDCSVECVDVWKFYIRNKEQRTTTYHLSWGGSETLNHNQTWNSGWVSHSSLTVTWVDAGGRNRSKTLDNCNGRITSGALDGSEGELLGFTRSDVTASCHSDFWCKTDCVYE